MPDTVMPTTAGRTPAGTAARVARPMQADQGLMVRSGELLQGRRSIAIEHNGAVYRLQTTRQGKLILTK